MFEYLCKIYKGVKVDTSKSEISHDQNDCKKKRKEEYQMGVHWPE